ncbi:MAG TPA: SMP-30/gluconolactonase/LRE family protein, partial [Pyrinomonadaceae bacterium]|nr:SMP-30/gluconolactonase/LRE family protein [Pyrinomonadaceae bacterium]
MKTLSAVTLLILCFFPVAFGQDIEVATTVAFTEGPTVDSAGNVFFTDQPNNRIMKLAVDGKLSTFRQPANFPNGLVFDPQWRLLACEAGELATGTPARITRTDFKTGTVEVLVDKYEGKHFVSPNDITFDGKGRIYFSDKPAKYTGEGGVYRIDLDGRVARILGPPEIEVPNGLIISPDDKTFYLIEANGAEKGARVIRAYDLQPDGSVTRMRIFHSFYPGRSGDG